MASTNIMTSNVSTSTEKSVTSINTTVLDYTNGSMTSGTYSTFTRTVSLGSPSTTGTSHLYTNYVSTKVFSSAESFNSSHITFHTSSSANDDTSNVSNTTMTLNIVTSTITFRTTNAPSIHPSNETTFVTASNFDSANPTSLKSQYSADFSNNNSHLAIALSVSLSVIFLIFVAVIFIIRRNYRRKRLRLERAPVRIEVPDIFVRLSDQLVYHKRDQHISQLPAVLGMEEIQRISSSSIINSKIPDKKADNIGLGSQTEDGIATIVITENTFQSIQTNWAKGDKRTVVQEIAKIPVTTRYGYSDKFHKQKREEDGLSETMKVLANQHIEDDTFTEIKL